MYKSDQEKSITGIQTDNLIVGYGKKPLLSDIALSVQAGKIVTLLGPNGCGKSTILKTLTRQLEKLQGEILVCGKELHEISQIQLAQRMSMVTTQRMQPEMMTCQEVVEMGRYPYTGRMGFLREEDKQVVRRVMELLKATEIKDAYFTQISDGQRQRIMLARALCQEPDILVLDEPTAYLDIRFKLEILSQIKQYAKEKNIAVVMSLHEPDLAAKVSDEVVAIGYGGISCMGSVQEIINKDFICKLYEIGKEEFQLLTEGQNWWEIDKIEKLKEQTNSIEQKKPEQANLGVTNHLATTKKKKAKVIMVQGTMSNAGKSLLVAGLCRILVQDGYQVAPFKSQNMALNSYITEEGLEMGRAQVMQAQCAKRKPSVYMNPILLKPTDDVGSQVIVNGEVLGNMKARDYFAYKPSLVPVILKAFEKLSETADVIVVEGAGSPAEINLKENDIVNMGLAKMLDAPVLLVGDIDRGGVFAQLYGTLALLEPDEKARIKGLIINKFRGDKSLLDSGITMLEEKGNIPVVGVVPFMDVDVEDEDSLSQRFHEKQRKAIDIAVIRLPHISNFTDMNAFAMVPDVSVRYVTSTKELEGTQMIILPGTKNTIGDLRWLKEKGFDVAIQKQTQLGSVIFGICGGYQMLGEMVSDPEGVEIGTQEIGLSLLPVETILSARKERKQFQGKVLHAQGEFAGLKDAIIEGYEIHMGQTKLIKPDGEDEVGKEPTYPFTSLGTGYHKGNVYGTYIHGFFDKKEILEAFISMLATKSQGEVSKEQLKAVKDFECYREEQFDKMAAILRQSLDMKAIYQILEE